VEERTFPDGAGGRVTTIQRTEEQRRPRSVFADAGFEYKLGPNTEAGGVIGFGTRDDTRHSRQTNLARRADGVTTIDNDRVRAAPETEREWEFELKFTHAFDGKDRELTIELQREIESEREDSRYLNVHRLPVGSPRQERMLDEAKQYDTELTIDYSHRLGAGAKVEAGYAGEAEKNDDMSTGSSFDADTGR
jgi:hypothetical protein